MVHLPDIMRSGQVYQPTTTTLTYDRNKPWLPSFLAQNTSPLWTKVLILIMSVLFAVMGLIMIVIGATSYDVLEDETVIDRNRTAYITVLCIGVLLLLAGLTALLIYFRNMSYYIPCCPGKIARIRKRLHENQMVVNGQIVSSGAPVSAQYCPPAQPQVASSPPPPYSDVSEQQRLMEEKPELGDDIERILEEDPRIVLTPLKSHEEC